MIALAEHVDGCILPVRAQPGARRNAAVGEHAGALKITVTAPPEDGRANQALIETLSKLLDVKRSQIQLLSGAKSRDKRFLINGCTRQELEERLRNL